MSNIENKPAFIPPLTRVHSWRGPKDGWTQEKYIKVVSERFSGRFDYSKTQFTKITLDITFNCPLHGEITMQAAAHMRSSWGCPTCSAEQMYHYSDRFMGRASANKKVDAPTITSGQLNPVTYRSLDDVIRHSRKQAGQGLIPRYPNQYDEE